MTKHNQPKPGTTKKQPAQTGELSDVALNQATGAMLACTPAGQTTARAGDTKAAGDGSVKTDSAMLACRIP
jgi:outer membrane biosynthesis protein TonB